MAQASLPSGNTLLSAPPSPRSLTNERRRRRRFDRYRVPCPPKDVPAFAAPIHGFRSLPESRRAVAMSGRPHLIRTGPARAARKRPSCPARHRSRRPAPASDPRASGPASRSSMPCGLPLAAPRRSEDLRARSRSPIAGRTTPCGNRPVLRSQPFQIASDRSSAASFGCWEDAVMPCESHQARSRAVRLWITWIARTSAEHEHTVVFRSCNLAPRADVAQPFRSPTREKCDA